MTAATLHEVQTPVTHAADDRGGERPTAQETWAVTPVRDRLRILRAARHLLAGMSQKLAAAIDPELPRTPADTRVAEILPLLAACQFLERNAERLLTPRKLGWRGLPFWLAGVVSEIHRVPLGRVLVIGPSNYPLFIPGVQTLQALAAGNTVTWKPGRGGHRVATLVAQALAAAGLPKGTLQITAESIEAVDAALSELPAKVFFTGSAETGRLLMRKLAETLTPCVMELSGCDAVIVLPSANVDRVVQALVFGMRLNGSATCMAPRRVLLVSATAPQREQCLSKLLRALESVAPVPLSTATQRHMDSLLADAVQSGARIHGSFNESGVRPIVVSQVQPEFALAQADLFAPVLSIIAVADEPALLAAQQACPFSLTAAIFGDEQAAQRVAAKITAGTVLINDIIVPTADPRVPFGGRRQSGFGVTRGTEGLLEMTAIKTVAVRRGSSIRHYRPTTATHASLFDGLIAAAHAGSWRERWQGIQQVSAAGKKLKRRG